MLNEHHKRLLCHMLQYIELYRNGVIRYSNLVNGMEGILDAGEFQDENFIRKWYDYWTLLEIMNATSGDSTTLEDANMDLRDMESFLKTFFSSAEDLHSYMEDLKM